MSRLHKEKNTKGSSFFKYNTKTYADKKNITNYSITIQNPVFHWLVFLICLSKYCWCYPPYLERGNYVLISPSFSIHELSELTEVLEETLGHQVQSYILGISGISVIPLVITSSGILHSISSPLLSYRTEPLFLTRMYLYPQRVG